MSPGGISQAVRRRWRGEVPLRTVLWRDMLTAGTVLNLCTGVASLIMLATGGDVRWAVLVHFAPLPINLFLLSAVFRAPQAGGRAKAIAVAWFATVFFI